MAICYMNMTSTLVMQNTQLSESLNKDFKDYLLLYLDCPFFSFLFLQYFESSKSDIRNRKFSIMLGKIACFELEEFNFKK